MTWRTARAIEALFNELNTAAPKRSRLSDGTVGDAAHFARGSASDHNPWVLDNGVGVVTAGDYTDDDAHGADMAQVVRYLTQESRDRRIKYVIHARKIYSSYETPSAPAWGPREYTGPNAHLHHMHVSVLSVPGAYDDPSPWGIAKALGVAAPKPPVGDRPHVGSGTTNRAPRFPLPDGYYFGPREPLSNARSVSGYYRYGDSLKTWQRQMRVRGWTLSTDGRYGPQTAQVARAFQAEKRLVRDGLIGPATWAAAWMSPVT